MFKTVFDQRQQQQRGYGQPAIIARFVESYRMAVGGYAFALQIDIGADYLGLFFERNGFAGGVVENIAQKIGELQDDLFGVRVVFVGQRLDGIKVVEKKMGIDLGFQGQQLVVGCLFLENQHIAVLPHQIECCSDD